MDAQRRGCRQSVGRTSIELHSLAVLAIGALAAGFINGFAGFGTALVASGFWFLVLPPQIVPPLIIVSALVGQIVGLLGLSSALNWRKGRYLLSGGLVGVPFGAGLLALMDPGLVKSMVGGFLIAYAFLQFAGWPKPRPAPSGEGMGDRLIGLAGGVMGGFAGLSGVAPLVWLQLRGFSASAQRERYQPFNLLVLAFAAGAMLLIGKLDKELLIFAAVSVPFTLIGAFVGVRAFKGVSDKGFRKAVLLLLLISGAAIVVQSL
ncbi:sulfite exporter TauE/SafE family protein [Phycobacter sp. K97]|uniref:sulfite exporter TauE/SafE family protein n=1 Tax=Phycobacter sedimenti TaxID=3133977 RepID=UPI00311E4023